VLNLVVIRSAVPEKLHAFYEALGMQFEKHAHGSGPEHFAAVVGAVTFEIYPARNAADATTAVRLGFSVPSVEEAIGKLLTAGGRLVAPAKDSPWGRRAVVDDPEGHRVELTQPL
jgi:predicted enzyme related to lactoylglutathione lyase